MSSLSNTMRRRIAHGVSYVFLTVVGITMIFPLYWMVLTSVKTSAEDVLDPAEWWPTIPWRLSKYDIHDWPTFCQKVLGERESDRPATVQRVRELIPEKSRQTFKAVSRKAPPAGSGEELKAGQLILEAEKSTILVALNDILQDHDFYDEQVFQGLPLTEEASQLLESIRADPLRLRGDDIIGGLVFASELAAAAELPITIPAKRVWEALSPRTNHLIQTIITEQKERKEGTGAATHLSSKQMDDFIVDLNNVTRTASLFKDADFSSITVPTEAARLLDRPSDMLTSLEISRLNGLLLKSLFPRQINLADYDRRVSYFNRLVFDALFPQEVVPTHRFHWENYKIVIVETKFARVLFNSVFVTICVTFGLVFTSSLAAFSFARLIFIGRDKIFLSYLATMMIPGAVTMIPVFILLRELQWINTYRALIIPMMFSAYGTFLLRQFFMSIPRDLEEAALLDGASIWGIYWHVVLPLSKPALAALTILTFIGSWRSFMWPLIVSHTHDMYTLPVALAAFQQVHGVQWTLMMAGSVIMVIPMLLVFIVGQRYFMAGIRLGALKG